jgi:hypothetical protein
MDSLRWVDHTYVQKHKTENPHNLRALYHQNLEQYPAHAPRDQTTRTPLKQTIVLFVTKQGRKAAISLTVLALSYLPYVGRFVLPAASFYTFNKAVGPQPAAAIFAGSLLFPRRYLVTFLQAYFSSRTLMRELVRHVRRQAIASTHKILARAVLCTRQIRQGTEEAMVQGSCGGAFWLWSRLLCLRQNPTCGCFDLRSCRSFHCLSHHQDHGTTASTQRG